MKSLTSRLFNRGKQMFLLALVVILIFSQAGWVSAQTPGPEGQGERVLAVYGDVAKSNEGQPLPPRFVTTAAGTLVDISPVDANLVRETPAANDAFEAFLWAGVYQEVDNGPVYTGRSVLQFPLDIIPPNANITKAELKLQLCAYYDYPDMTREVSAYRVRNLWHQSLVTWGSMPVLGEIIDSVTVGLPDISIKPFTYSIDLTVLAKGWYDGSIANDGILLSSDEDPDAGGRAFCSNDTTYPSTLQVTYTAAPPTLSATNKELVILTDDPVVLTAPKVIEIANNGSAPLDWQFDPTSIDWMTFDRASGSIGPDMIETVTATVKNGIFTPGMKKTGQLQVTSATPGASGSPQVIQVSASLLENEFNLYLPAIVNSKPSGSSLQSMQVAPKKTVALVIGISDFLNLPNPPTFASIRWNGEWSHDTNETRNLNENTERLLASVFSPPTMTSLSPAAMQFNTYVMPSNPRCVVKTLGDLSIISLSESQASYEGIQEAMLCVDTLEDANTRVLFLYAGHGGQIADDNGDEASDVYDEFIPTWDTNLEGTSYVRIIRDDQLKQWVDALESQEIGIFIDACNSGGFNDVQGPGRILLLSSEETESSTEISGLRSSTFMYYFFEALMDSTADSNKDGWVSAQEAYAYLAPKVTDEVSRFGDQQHPVMVNNMGGTQFTISDLSKVYLPGN